MAAIIFGCVYSSFDEIGKIIMPATLEPRPSQLSAQEFVASYGSIYEHSPWVAEIVARDGVDEMDDQPAVLARRMAEIVENAGDDRKLELLRAHPELAGKLAVRDELTEESKDEQASAGLDRCSPDEFQRFQELNGRYNDKFGFPFIIAVRDLQRDQILGAFGQRMENEPDVEFQTALDQVHKIARLRLEAMASDHN